MRRWLGAAAAAVVTGLALLYAFWDVDMVRLGQLLAHADYRVLLPYALFLVLFFLFTALRWILILRPLGRYGLRQTVPAMMIGFAGNNVFPAHLGELVRTVVFSRQTGLPAASVLVTLVAERLLDIFAILCFYFLAVLVIRPFPEGARAGAETVAVVGVLACALIAWALALPGQVRSLWGTVVGRLPARLHQPGTELLENILSGLAALRSPGLLALMAAHSLLKWLAAGAAVWASLQGFGESIGLPVSMIVIAVVALAVTVPSAPGYFGAIQAAFVFSLLPFGVSRETALAASVLYLLAQWIPVTLIGGAFFFASGLKLGEVRHDAQEISPRK